ncbi:MAG: M20/M25/M40 family metallo-hydrolase, partial [Blastocatellia bacterium]
MRKITAIVVGSICLLTLMMPVFGQEHGSQDEAARRIASSILINGHVMEYETGLANGFGGRLTGSPAYNKAAEWAADQFRAAGIKNVRFEPFTIKHGWLRGRAWGQMLSPLQRPLHIESLGWTESTPPGGVKGNVVMVSDLSAEKLKADAGKLRGNIAMLDLAAIFAARSPDAIGQFFQSFKRLQDSGAAAVIVGDSERNNVLNAFAPSFDTTVPAIPVAQVGMEDAKLMQNFMNKGPVTIQFECQNTVSGPTEVNDVVAEIPGSEHPDEWVIVGAHLDSWDYGTGAKDNGTGTAMVLEAARAIATLGRPPRRSIRFALWGGEEEGILGSLAYVKNHDSELAKCVAVVNTDNGAGRPKGWKVEGRKDMADAMKQFNSILAGLGGAGISQETTFDTDHGPFMLHGVPSLDLWLDMTHYGEIHHKSSDTVDKIDVHDLTDDAAIVAVTAYAIADGSERIAPQIDHEAVEQILKKADLEGFLKALGVW